MRGDIFEDADTLRSLVDGLPENVRWMAKNLVDRLEAAVRPMMAEDVDTVRQWMDGDGSVSRDQAKEAFSWIVAPCISHRKQKRDAFERIAPNVQITADAGWIASAVAGFLPKYVKDPRFICSITMTAEPDPAAGDTITIQRKPKAMIDLLKVTREVSVLPIHGTRNFRVRCVFHPGVQPDLVPGAKVKLPVHGDGVIVSAPEDGWFIVGPAD